MEWQGKGLDSGYVDRNGYWQPEDVSYVSPSLTPLCTLKVKVKPVEVWTGPKGSRRLRLPVYRQSTREGGKMVIHTHRSPLPPRKYSWYSFLLEDSGSTVVKVAGSIPAGVSGLFIDINSFRSPYGPGVDSASNRNEYQGYFLWVKAAGA